MTEIENAVIDSATIDIERGFILSAWLHVNMHIVSQGFGGFVLYLGKSSDHHKVKSVAGHFLYRCLEIAEVEEWSQLKGKSIRVVRRDGRIVGVGHIIKDDWFYPEDDFEEVSDED